MHRESETEEAMEKGVGHQDWHHRVVTNCEPTKHVAKRSSRAVQVVETIPTTTRSLCRGSHKITTKKLCASSVHQISLPQTIGIVHKVRHTYTIVFCNKSTRARVSSLLERSASGSAEQLGLAPRDAERLRPKSTVESNPRWCHRILPYHGNSAYFLCLSASRMSP